MKGDALTERKVLNEIVYHGDIFDSLITSRKESFQLSAASANHIRIVMFGKMRECSTEKPLASVFNEQIGVLDDGFSQRSVRRITRRRNNQKIKQLFAQRSDLVEIG